METMTIEAAIERLEQLTPDEPAGLAADIRRALDGQDCRLTLADARRLATYWGRLYDVRSNASWKYFAALVRELAQ